MKKVGFFSLAFSLAGCFLGTGFISGQEQWQYFGVFGVSGFVGLMLAMLLIFIFCAVMLSYARKTEECEFDRLVIAQERPYLRTAVGAVTVFFMFTTYVVMTAGAGDLLNQTFGLPSYVGRALICILIMTVSFLGISGMFSVLSVFIPILIVFTFVIFFASPHPLSLEAINAKCTDVNNPLLSSWWISALNSATYNVGSSLGVIVTIGAYAKSRKSVLLGTGVCMLALTVFSCCLLIVMHAHPEITQAQLPMVAYAGSLSSWVGKLFAVFLFVGMFSSSLAISVSVCNYMQSKLKKMPRALGVYGLPFVMALIAFLCGEVGFSSLVSVVYPISGYVSILFIVLIIINYVRHKVSHEKGESRQ